MSLKFCCEKLTNRFLSSEKRIVGTIQPLTNIPLILYISSLFAINAQGELRISANQDNLTENQYDVVVIVTDNGVPSRQSSAVVKVKFPPLNPTIGNVTMKEAGSDVVSICLGVVAATLLIIVIILTVYIVRR